MSAKFGPAGNADSFSKAHRSSVEAPEWIAGLGLDCYEYQCGKGVHVGEETARSLGADDGQEAFSRMLDRVEEVLGTERAARFHSHFSHIQFTPGGGEKCHRTFSDNDGYGPGWAPLAAEVARRGWSPTFICESAGTQAEDALTMERIYEQYAANP